MGYSTLEIHSAAMSQQVVRYVQFVHVQDDGCQTCFYQDDGFQTCFIKTMAARLVLSRRWLPDLFYQDDGFQTGFIKTMAARLVFYQDDGCQTCFYDAPAYGRCDRFHPLRVKTKNSGAHCKLFCRTEWLHGSIEES